MSWKKVNRCVFRPYRLVCDIGFLPENLPTNFPTNTMCRVVDNSNNYRFDGEVWIPLVEGYSPFSNADSKWYEISRAKENNYIYIAESEKDFADFPKNLAPGTIIELYDGSATYMYTPVSGFCRQEVHEVSVTATEVGIVDAGGYYDSSNVEGALQELGVKVAGRSVTEVKELPVGTAILKQTIYRLMVAYEDYKPGYYYHNGFEWQQMSVSDTNAVKQFVELPNPSVDYLNEVVQYIGETTTDYISNNFYKCTYLDNIYAWERVDVNRLPYSSLVRRANYLFDITFDTLPPDKDIDSVPTFCSTYVKDGKMYRNLDLVYTNMATFHVTCPEGIEGTAELHGLNSLDLDDDLLGQLPYHLVDGKNEHGIMVSEHVLFNDWGWTGSGDIQLYKFPYIVLSTITSLNNFPEKISGILRRLKPSSILIEREYLLQFLVTDGVTSYAVVPPTSAGGTYSAIDISSNPKLTNFRWVDSKFVDRRDLQTRPCGVERYNMMPCELNELRYTKAYEEPTRLSEFIGMNYTTKDSTDEELMKLYDIARIEYLNRTRDGQTWQTTHSVVYSSNRLEHLYIQENWNVDYVISAGEEAEEAAKRAEAAAKTAADAALSAKDNAYSANESANYAKEAAASAIDASISAKDNAYYAKESSVIADAAANYAKEAAANANDAALSANDSAVSAKDNAYSAKESAVAADAAANYAKEASANANDSALSAKDSAYNAKDAAASANESAYNARGSASDADASAAAAEESAVNATEASVSAKDSAYSAKDSAASANESAYKARDSATIAHDSAIDAESFSRISGEKAEDSEAWATGKRNGIDVPDTDPAYHNNAKYYSENINKINPVDKDETMTLPVGLDADGKLYATSSGESYISLSGDSGVLSEEQQQILNASSLNFIKYTTSEEGVESYTIHLKLVGEHDNNKYYQNDFSISYEKDEGNGYIRKTVITVNGTAWTARITEYYPPTAPLTVYDGSSEDITP